MSHWQNIHPVVRLFIILISCFMAIGGLAYIRIILEDAWDKWEAQKKQANKTITAIPRKEIDFRA